MSIDGRILNEQLTKDLLGTMREWADKPVEDPVIKAMQLALEMTTPTHAGYPAEHPEHSSRKKNSNLLGLDVSFDSEEEGWL